MKIRESNKLKQNNIMPPAEVIFDLIKKDLEDHLGVFNDAKMEVFKTVVKEFQSKKNPCPEEFAIRLRNEMNRLQFKGRVDRATKVEE